MSFKINSRIISKVAKKRIRNKTFYRFGYLIGDEKKGKIYSLFAGKEIKRGTNIAVNAQPRKHKPLKYGVEGRIKSFTATSIRDFENTPYFTSFPSKQDAINFISSALKKNEHKEDSYPLVLYSVKMQGILYITRDMLLNRYFASSKIVFKKIHKVYRCEKPKRKSDMMDDWTIITLREEDAVEKIELKKGMDKIDWRK